MTIGGVSALAGLMTKQTEEDEDSVLISELEELLQAENDV